MWLLSVSVCLAIFSSSLTLASEPHYVITFPVNLVQGIEEKVCVTFLDLTGAVDLKLELKKDDQVHIVAEEKIDAPDYSKCYHFQVPVIKEDLSVWSLHLTAHGDHIDVDESKKVVLMQIKSCIIQTDKAIYKPGDTVKFQLISVDHHIHATDQTFPLIEITDSNKHRIAQWLKVSTSHGFASFSFHLADEISHGNYKINLPGFCTKNFNVEEYVLKRFEVIITSPPDVTLLDKSFHMEACGRYTYGKPVQGSIDLNICLKQKAYYSFVQETSGESEEGENCINVKNAKMDSNGCLSKDISLERFNVISKSDQRQILLIKSSVTEDLTGHIEKASADVNINTRKTITFFEKMAIYQKDLPFHTRVKVTDEKKQPMPNKAVYLYDDRHSGEPHTSVTDEDGIAHFTLNTSKWRNVDSLRASLSSGEDEDEDRHSVARCWILPFYSESESHLSIEKQSVETECNSDQTVTVKYDIHRKNLDSDTDHLHFFSLLRSKNGILSYKEHKIDIKDQANNPTVQGSFPVSFHVDADLFPVFFQLVFILLPNGEMIANVEQYRIPLCANEKVQLKFSEEQVRPGASVNLEVSANAGAYCSIRSVDKGYLLQKPHDRSLLSDFIRFSDLGYVVYTVRNLAEDPVSNQCPENETALDTMFMMAFQLDPYSLFMHSGLKTFTNTKFKSPPICVENQFSARSGTKLKKPGDKDKEIQEHFTRRDFTDSWIFEVVPVDSDGHTVLNRATPHSITKWVTDAICLSKTGFASVTGVELTTFQPYFIDLMAPYSVVQGEKFTIQAVVFSYAKKCILIVVSLPDSEEFATVKNREQARCVCEGHAHSFTWDVTAVKPKTLKVHVDSGSLEVDGKCTEDPLLISSDHREDSVEKTIVVKPRGHEEEKTQTFIIYPPENKEDIHFTLELPERLVPGSERAHLLVQGDIMANINVNLNNLLYMPDGCGEQSAAKFLRFLYTLEYLESIHELTPEKKASIIESLEKAYQKQLTFRTESGSYGFFNNDDKGNIWLTSLVVKAFNKAQKWIYIDEKQIQESVKWIQSLQQPDGCFEEKGQYFNNKLKVDNDAGRTAFVLISVFEQQKTCNGSIVENALSCLRKSVDSDLPVHTLALMAYAFTLSGDSELRDQMLKKLDEKAVITEGTKHWKQNPEEPDDIETLSYIVLALLSDKTITSKDLGESLVVIGLLTTLQNPYGGFRSSQDTTVALEALTKYAKATNNQKRDSTVTISSESGFQKIVHVEKSNSLLVQTVDLPKIPEKYTVSNKGDGFVLLQVHLHYNAFPKASDKDYFSLNVSTEPSACTHESQKKFDVHVDVRYTGKRENTNMALILIEPTSGYIPDKKSLEKLKQHPGVQRTEVSAEKVTIYLDTLTHATESYVLSLEQESNVENLQPATVVVHDYYFPEEHAVAEYNAPCCGVVAHCDVKVDERGDCGRSGITKEECEGKGCCFNSSIYASKWCFFKGFKKIEVTEH
ncbi:alpha-2-macroglobulin-like protein 1 [Bufo gargarizans]|uniref:alpha-2-macroglobulin-like protein 1 n=1 Tax=Bufo gargarizans TaxID=30331 RepID=UPI001CF37778|nr:alpha-2-macroglobulin-like protein 1 [Bufo gargarizans]